MNTLEHGRQTGATLKQIRLDHRNRYAWAAATLPPYSIILDAGCGIGYGSFMMAKAGHRVLGIDADRGAIDIAQRNYAHPNVTFLNLRIEDAAFWLDKDDHFQAVTCFEVFEHLPGDKEAACDLSLLAPRLLCSVPNETEYPFLANRPLGHLRHYTEDDFEELLDCWAVDENVTVSCFHQVGKTSLVAKGWTGRTLVADAVQ